MGFLLTLATAIGGPIAGWKIAKRRGANPATLPTFRTRKQYLRRAALLGAIANFVVTVSLWSLIGTFSIANGSRTIIEVALIATAAGAFFAPIGALGGAVCGWVWYHLDSVRRKNHATPQEDSPAAPTGVTMQQHAIPPFNSAHFPSDLGAARLPNSTGDELWDDFHNTQPPAAQAAAEQ